MSERLVVHTGARPDEARPIEEAILDVPGVRFEKRGPCPTPEAVLEAVADAHAAICVAEPYDATVFAGAPQFRGVVRTGVGVDTIDLAAATEYGVLVGNLPDFCIREVANHAIALLLDCAKRVTWMNARMHTGGWSFSRQILQPMGAIHGQTLGLVAFGNIARATAKRAQAFEMEVIAYDPYVPAEEMAGLGVESVSLEELAARSDYVSCHVPLNPNTKGMLGAGFFGAMKPTAYLINTSRGGVLRQDELVAVLQKRGIAGAALDVFEREPLPMTDPLMQLDNVILTPHTASFADATFEMLFRRVAQSALAIAQGGHPEHVANPDVLGHERG